MSLRVEERATSALQEWLLKELPAKVAAVNTRLRATITTPTAGPWAVANGTQLGIGPDRDTTGYSDLLAAGSYTAGQLAAAFTASPGLSAFTFEALDDGRLRITAPSATDLVLSPLGTANEALGFPPNMVVFDDTITAPGLLEVYDGWPVMFGADNTPGRMVLVIGDRSSAPNTQNVRRDTYRVALELVVMVCVGGRHEQRRSRKQLAGAVEAVRDALFTTPQGRQLGVLVADDGDAAISLVTETSAVIGAKPFSFGNGKSLNPLFDVAALKLSALVYERQA